MPKKHKILPIAKEKLTEDYGENIYIVQVVKSVSKEEEIVVRADNMVVEDGDIVFLHIDEDGNELVTFSIARGNWKTFYLADKKFKFPVSVERWDGVAGVKIIEKIIPTAPIIKETPAIIDDICPCCGKKDIVEEEEEEESHIEDEVKAEDIKDDILSRLEEYKEDEPEEEPVAGEEEEVGGEPYGTEVDSPPTDEQY